MIAPESFRDEEYAEPKTGLAGSRRSRHDRERRTRRVHRKARHACDRANRRSRMRSDRRGTLWSSSAAPGAQVFFDDAEAHALARQRARERRYRERDLRRALDTCARAGLLEGVEATAFPSQESDLRVTRSGLDGCTGDRRTEGSSQETGRRRPRSSEQPSPTCSVFPPSTRRQQVKMYRCRICGETYLGTRHPRGARSAALTSDTWWILAPTRHPRTPSSSPRRNGRTLSARSSSRASNARFYAAMARVEGDEALASAYKRLSRIEAEHCSLFCKLAGVPKPSDLTEPSDASAGWCENIAESLDRERTASAFYAEAAARATNDRVVEVLQAVSAIERDHIDLDGVAARMAGC